MVSIEQSEMRPSRLRLYLEMVRFSHTIFAMPFAILATVWSVALGWTESGWESPTLSPLRWLAVGICMVTARNFAMTVNRIADRQIDAENPRTSMRHLPAGLISLRNASFFAVLNAAGFIASCLLFLPNWLPIVLAVPVLIFLAGYSYAKRFTSGVHFYLGVSLMIAPVCAWLALRGEIVLQQPADLLPAVLLGGVVLFWVSGFDLIYACQDFDYDKSRGLYSIPAKLGVQGALRLAAVLHGLMLIPAVCLPFLCPQLGLSWFYLAGVAIIAGVLIYENCIVNPNDLSRVNAAFFQANAIVGLVFLVAGGLDAWW